MLSFFFFNDTATTEIYTLSLHDALPILPNPLDARQQLLERLLDQAPSPVQSVRLAARPRGAGAARLQDRKSTRLNSSHGYISYAVFCLKKKTKTRARPERNTAALHTPLH